MWVPYKNWKEKARSFDKFSEVKKFCESVKEVAKRVPMIKHMRGKRSRLNDKIIDETFEKMKQRRIYEEDLDPKLWEGEKGWVEKMVKLSTNLCFSFEEAKEKMEKFKSEIITAVEEKWLEKEAENKKKDAKEKKEEELRLAAKDRINEAVAKPTYIGLCSLDSNLWYPYENFYQKINKIEISQLENFVSQVLAAIEKVRKEEERGKNEKREEYSRKAQDFSEKPTKEQTKTPDLDELYEEEKTSLEEEINELKNNSNLPNDPELKRKLQEKEKEREKLINEIDRRNNEIVSPSTQTPYLKMVGITGIIIFSVAFFLVIIYKKKKKT